MMQLKSCPFCGSSARLVHPHSGNNPYITCDDCYIATLPNQSEERLIATWNKRTEASHGE